MADALSRKSDGEIILSTIITTPGVVWDKLEEEIKKDGALQSLREGVLNSDKDHSRYSIINNKLCYKGRCVIPSNSIFKTALLKEYHDSVSGGHKGELKTYLRLAVDWFWAGMRKDVAKYVQQCLICQ